MLQFVKFVQACISQVTPQERTSPTPSLADSLADSRVLLSRGISWQSFLQSNLHHPGSLCLSPPPGLVAHPGPQPSACGVAGHAGSGCPRRCHCRCGVSLPRVGVSGSRAGCWLLACSACSCSTWRQRAGPALGGGAALARGQASVPQCVRQGPGPYPAVTPTTVPKVLLSLCSGPCPLKARGGRGHSGLGARCKCSMTVHGMNDAQISDFLEFHFSQSPLVKCSHMCARLMDFLCCYKH